MNELSTLQHEIFLFKQEKKKEKQKQKLQDFQNYFWKSIII